MMAEELSKQRQLVRRCFGLPEINVKLVNHGVIGSRQLPGSPSDSDENIGCVHDAIYVLFLPLALTEPLMVTALFGCTDAAFALSEFQEEVRWTPKVKTKKRVVPQAFRGGIGYFALFGS
jgi:hypothetical protein